MLLRIFLLLNTTGLRVNKIKWRSVQFSRARESKTDLYKVFKFHFETCLRHGSVVTFQIPVVTYAGFFWGTFLGPISTSNFSKRTVHLFSMVFLTPPPPNKPKQYRSYYVFISYITPALFQSYHARTVNRVV